MAHTKLCQIPFRVIALNSKKYNILPYCQFGYSSSNFQNRRYYLTDAFRCDDKWENRFEDEFIKNVKPTEFYYDLIRKYKSDGKVSAVDADIFVNSLDKNKADALTEEFEEVIRLLRRSPETINTLPSTTHAFLRMTLDTKKYDLLFKVLTDPINYGVFLDYFTSNLLMNSFLKEDNFTAAARIASCSMLQEDFGPHLTRAFILQSCFKYAFNDKENEPWIDYHPVIEPEEEVKIIVAYIRNPSFDDHFDLREPLHIVGKTLAWLSFQLEDKVLKSHSEILGWSLFEKWNELESSLRSLLSTKQNIDEAFLSKVSSQVSNCKDTEMNAKLSSLLANISREKLTSSLNIIGMVEENLNKCTAKYEKEFTEIQQKTYDEWIVLRKKAVDEQVELLEKQRLMKEIEAKKEDLQRREDVIFYFENKNKFDLLTPKPKQYDPDAFFMRNGKKIYYRDLKKKVTEKDEEYFPPEVKRTN